MDKDLSKKLKKMMKVKGKTIPIATYAGRRKNYKIYKIGPTKFIAIRTANKIKGGATDEEIAAAVYVPEETSEFEGLHDLFKEDDQDSSIEEEVKTVKIVAEKPKRVQSEGNKKWLDFVKKVRQLPEMQGKSQSYVMKKAGELYRSEKAVV